MKNTLGCDENTLVTFHIGRCGKSHNSGFVTFQNSGRTILQMPADRFVTTLIDDDSKPFLVDDSGNILLDVEQYKKAEVTGCGFIDFDEEYDSIYTKKLVDCDEQEADAIFKAKPYNWESLIAVLIKLNVIDEENYRDL